MNNRIYRSMNIRMAFLTAAVLMVTACRKSVVPTPPAPQVDSARIMILQTSPYLDPTDLFLVNTDTFKINTTPVVYPGMRQYVSVPSGIQWLYIRVSGTFSSTHTGPFYFRPGGSYTLINPYNLRVQEDDLSRPSDGYARVRALQGATYGQPLDFLVRGGDTLAKGMFYLTVTDFQPIKAGAYTFDLQDSNIPNTYKTSLQVTLEAGRNYTILAKTLPVPDTSRIVVGAELINNN